MNIKSFCATALIVLAPLSAQAHHNSATAYDLAATITIEGVVRDFRLVNPHSRIYVTVVVANGESQEWVAEGANGGMLRRRLGWTVDQLKPGEKITIAGAPSRDGSRRVEWRTITRIDGTRLGGGNGFPQEREESRERLEQQRRNENSSTRK